MKCDEFTARLHRVLDARLQPEDDERLREHAEVCDGCFLVLQSQERLFYGLARLPHMEPTREFTDRVLAQAMPARALAAWTRFAVTAASIAALLFISFLAREQFGANGRLVPPGVAAVDTRNFAAVESSTPEPNTGTTNAEPQSPTPPREAIVADSDSSDHYRQLLAEVAEQMQRMSYENPISMDELSIGLRPVTGSISGAFTALRQTLPVGRSMPHDGTTKPQAMLDIRSFEATS